MTLLAALLLSLQEDSVVPVPADAGHECSAWEVALGGALWWTGDFEATTPFGRREITGELVVEADLELSYSYHDWTVVAWVAAGGTDDSELLLAGAELRTPQLLNLSPLEGFPVCLVASAGPLAGRFEVDEEGFGDFEPAFGAQAKLLLESSRWGSVRVALWTGVRALEFDYDETVLSGDDALGGATLAAGISGMVRF